ncbi:MAG: major capsid protein [Microviridae sp.]|nr:MAG: major capsid protein [Microviridae sp.]
MKYFQQPSVMSAQAHFAHAPDAEIQRSRFDRSHGHKTTLDAGFLVPVYVDEVLPGDTFDMKAVTFGRMSTPLRPVMDNIYLETFYFFVPYRLVWDNWQAFCGERKNPTDPWSTLTLPQVQVGLPNVLQDTLTHYMGIPIGHTGAINVSALPFRAYNLIWNEWFRDQNLQFSLNIPTDDGPDPELDATYLQPRGKRHDYFTSCLPWPQKGDAVLIPAGTVASDGSAMKWKAGPSGSPANMVIEANANLKQAGGAPATETAAHYGAQGLMIDNATATINDLRAAFQIQRLLERDARGGTRYIELILAHFGVRSDDARLQRPEYLGGGSARININPVPSTFASTEIAQGDLGGVGTVVNRAGFHKSFTEHGIIIGLANIRADLTYQDGVERFWRRQTRYDFYWPALAHLGEQAVLNSEIFVQGTAADDGVFGYQERYAEYRYKPSRISGRFASKDPASLDVWHLGQDFAALPVLNPSFITDNPPMDRIIATPDEPQFLLDIWFQLTCARPLPVYSVPGLSDHF